MKRTVVLLLCSLFVLSAAGQLHAWGSVTHAYFAHELGCRWGYLNLQEMYGSTLPDIANIMFGSPYQNYLYGRFHYEFMELVNRAYRRDAKAEALGFASHNDAWGADFTAHHEARTIPGAGYVVAKQNAVVPALVPQLTAILQGAGVPDAGALAEELAPGLADNFIETAIDLLVRRNEDPLIGYRLALAARLRSYTVPFLLIRAYAADLANAFGLPYTQAAAILYSAEREFRSTMKLYGGIFTRNEQEAIALIAEQGAALAAGILKAETGLDIAVPPSMLAEFLAGVVIPCVEPDYAAEISATLAYLEGMMNSTGLGASSDALADAEEPVTPDAGGLHIGQNYPNPFNPVTSIDYTLPEDGHVEVAVFDAAGRRVEVLVSGYERRGRHTATWNASGVPSGVYFCRIKACGEVLTRKMCLLR